MKHPPKKVFLAYWPSCLVTFMGIIELLAVIILFLSELANVAANFWTTNVFGGGWCGIVVLIHVIAIFIVGCCSPGPKSAYNATIIAFIAMLACATLIGFDSYFIVQDTTCILTPSCAYNAASNTSFSFSFQQSFYVVFNSWSPFKNYAQIQVKLLCQAMQIGVAAVCIIICLIYLIIYYITVNKANKQVQPAPQPQQQGYPPQLQPQVYPPQQSYYAPPPFQPDFNSPPPAQQGYYPPPPQQQYYQPPPPPPQRAWRPEPQAQPGVIPWNQNRKY